MHQRRRARYATLYLMGFSSGKALSPARILAACAYAAFFLWLTLGSLTSWFSSDDLMNLYYYWTRSTSDLVVSLLAPSTAYYRPVGGVFYKSIHAIFGFSPLPFHIAQLVLASANVCLLYKFASSLSNSGLTGFAAVMAGGVHAAQVWLYYDSGMIYDVLAFSFYFSALLWYIGMRLRDRVPDLWRTVALGILAMAGIKSKEVAVSLPAAMLLFELVWNHRELRVSSFHGLLAWIKGPGRVISLTGGLVAIYIGGRYAGQDQLLSHPAYKPDISLPVFLSVAAAYLQQFLYRTGEMQPGLLVGIWAGMLALGAVFRRKVMVWSVLFVICATLPVGFIPVRNGFAYCIPAVGYFVFFGSLISLVRDLCSRAIAASVYRWKPGIVHAAVSAVTGLALAAWLGPLHTRMFAYPLAVANDKQIRNRDWQSQILQLIPNPKPGARFLILNDPLDTYDLLFLLALSYDDRSIYVNTRKVSAGEKNVLLDAESGAYDHVLEHRDGRFILLK